jgi:hypothetical protein
VTAVYIAVIWLTAGVIVAALHHAAKTLVQRYCPCEEVHT